MFKKIKEAFDNYESEESDESENLCEQIFFQNFNENEILQIFEGNIQNNYTFPITQTDSVPISQNLLEEPQQEQNNESVIFFVFNIFTRKNVDFWNTIAVSSILCCLIFLGLKY